MQFHKEPLALILTNERNIPSKINPKRNPIMCQNILFDKLCTKLKTIACKAIDIFVPYSNFSSSSNQPLKIISSANPTPNPSTIEFNNILARIHLSKKYNFFAIVVPELELLKLI